MATAEQLDLLDWEPAPAGPPPPPEPSLDDIAEAWTWLTGEPYPGRAAALAEFAAWCEGRT